MTHCPASATVFEDPTTEDSPLVFQARFHRKRRDCRTVLSSGETSPSRPQPCRLAIALALAHKIEQAISEGKLRDRAHAAKLLDVTRARMTQNLDLLLLAPDLQEEILAMETIGGRQPLSQARLRPLVAKQIWAEQRRLWQSIRRHRPGAPDSVC